MGGRKRKKAVGRGSREREDGSRWLPQAVGELWDTFPAFTRQSRCTRQGTVGEKGTFLVNPCISQTRSLQESLSPQNRMTYLAFPSLSLEEERTGSVAPRPRTKLHLQS